MKIFGTGYFNFNKGIAYGFGRKVSKDEAEVVFLEYQRIKIGDTHYKNKEAEVLEKVVRELSKRFKGDLDGRESDYITDTEDADKFKKKTRKIHRRMNVWLKRLIPHFPPQR